MQLGWVDFSDEERHKVMDVIRQLSQPEAVDELGTGVIRNAFSDYFFPGTSTVQTRAKYFIIVPFILKELGDDSANSSVEQLMIDLTQKEKKCAEYLIRNSSYSEDGIIGRNTLPGWVERSPSDIYWNGIKTYNIFTPYQMSIKGYFDIAIQRSLDKKNKGYDKSKTNKGKQSNKHSPDCDEDWDDLDAGYKNGLCHWDINEIYSPDWLNDVSIKLTCEEAVFLKRKITESQHGTLLAYLLENNFKVNDYEDFLTFSNAVTKKIELPQKLIDMITLANDFNDFIMLARTRYNIIYANYTNSEWNKRWALYESDIVRYCRVDIKAIYKEFNLRNMKLYDFLTDLQIHFANKDYKKSDELIRNWERKIKTRACAKLWSDVNSRDKNKWYGGTPSNPFLDYRFGTAKDIINDIQDAEEEKHA